MQSTDTAQSPKQIEDQRRQEFVLDHTDAVEQLMACAIVGDAYDFTLFEPISAALAPSSTPNPPKDLLRLTHPELYANAAAVDELRQRIRDLRGEIERLEQQLQAQQAKLDTSLPGVARDCFTAVHEKMKEGFFIDNPSINPDLAAQPRLFIHSFSPEASDHMARSLCGCRAELIGRVEHVTRSYGQSCIVEQPTHCVTYVCAVHHYVFGWTHRRLCTLFCELLHEKGVRSTEHKCKDK